MSPLKRILFLSASYPFPPDNGSKIRIYNLLRALSSRYEVTLLTFADSLDQTASPAAMDSCTIAGVVPRARFDPYRARALIGFANPLPRSLVDTYSPSMARLAFQQLRTIHYDAVVASEVAMASYLLRNGEVPVVLEDAENLVVYDAYNRASHPLSRARHYLTWFKAKHYIGQLLPRFAATTVVSEQERWLLKKIAPKYDRVEIIPNGVDIAISGYTEIEPEPRTLVFNGALTFSANLDAICYFLEDIWPHIRALEPDVSIKITGRTEGVGLKTLGPHEGVILTGYLPDIRPTVQGAWACVVPLRIGSGTRVKILEAMALGTPVVATSKGAEGLEVTPGVNILIADESEQFALETVRLLRDRELRARLALNARRLIEEKYNWRLIGERFNDLVQEVVSRRGPA